MPPVVGTRVEVVVLVRAHGGGGQILPLLEQRVQPALRDEVLFQRRLHRRAVLTLPDRMLVLIAQLEHFRLELRSLRLEQISALLLEGHPRLLHLNTGAAVS